MSALDNQSVFSTSEFDTWANRCDLIPAEKYLIETYLAKTPKTLEAGTGGGRILLEMEGMGFKWLHGFDYVPELIAQARKRDQSNTIDFSVQNAVSLSYQNSSFEQIIYLQQVLCCIESSEGRSAAVQEAYRILQSGGTALFSFLSYQVRASGTMYAFYLAYLSLFRKLIKRNTSLQLLPWLKRNGKPNLDALLDKPPYVYWFHLDEAYELLTDAGFKIVSFGSTQQIEDDHMFNSLKDAKGQPIKGMLYFVCQK